MCHERMSYALSVDVHILCHAKQTRSLVPFLSSEGYLKWWLVDTLMRKLATTELSVLKSLNLHSCLVAKFNRVFSLFSYCKCYLVASTGIYIFFLMWGVVSCQSDILWFIN